jgi:hypothetical protein
MRASVMRTGKQSANAAAARAKAGQSTGIWIAIAPGFFMHGLLG